MTRRVHVPRFDEPTKQLVNDLIKELEQVKIFNADLKKVHAYERQCVYDNLDRADAELEAAHNEALDKAKALHDSVRAEAEATLKQWLRDEEEARRCQEEEARKEKERIEREKAEKLQREQQEAARLEAERKAQEEAKKKAAEEAERAQKAAQEEQERKKREELEKAEAEKRKEAQQAEQKARALELEKIGAGRLTDQDVRVQERYVALHKTLKELRQWLRDMGKENPEVKKVVGDMRRTIKKSVGQLRDGKGANREQIKQIQAQLEMASKFTQPSVDIRKFLAFPPEKIANSEQKVPALLIYGLNIFAKCLISALITEASINPGHAEAIGVTAAQIFSMEAFIYQGIPMSDILWAKYRVVCPALWGFNGDEKTVEGKRAMGWWRVEAGGPFIGEQAHLDRMTALGAGFGALTLRNFGKSARRNPFPNIIFWTSISKILAIPPGQMTDTQITLLHNMLHYTGGRILIFFGQIGLALLRRAIITLPATLERQTMPVNQLKLLKETYGRDYHIKL